MYCSIILCKIITKGSFSKEFYSFIYFIFCDGLFLLKPILILISLHNIAHQLQTDFCFLPVIAGKMINKLYYSNIKQTNDEKYNIFNI